MQDFQTRWLMPLALALTLLSIAGKAAADDNLYRAEVVLFERIGGAQDIAEQMQTRQPEEAQTANKNLWVTTQDGQVTSDLSLVSRNNLYLRSSASRLESSGRYRVLMATGWVQSFPPDYTGKPLKISLGDKIDAAGDREIEGYINIDRVRYLHVTANLNQWQAATKTAQDGPARPENSERMEMSPDNPYMESRADSSAPDSLTAGNHPARELVTWLHQTRRMRSEEIHYLDSPTMGLLIYFQPLESQ